MRTLRSRDKLTDAILSPQKGEVGKDCRLCAYVQRVDTEDGILLYHLVTGELVWTCDLNQDGEALFQHYFLVPADHDDYRFYQSFSRFYAALTSQHTKSIQSYTILPTTDCNARCFYCYELGCKREAMSEATAERAVEYIQQNADPAKPIHLSWFGGEPLYHVESIDRITTALKAAGMEYTSVMISNGYLLDAEIVDRAVHLWKLKKVQITLDGTEEVYNQRKAYLNQDGGSAFQRVLRNIGLLTKAGVEVDIRLNLDRENYADLIRLIEVLDERFHGAQSKDADTMDPKPGALQIYCHELFQCAEEEGILDCKKAVDQKIKDCGFYQKQYLPLGMKTNYCMADSPDSVVILPDGTLHACEHFTAQTPFGTIFQNDNKKSALPFYRERWIEDCCKSCPVLPQCIRLKCCPNVQLVCKDGTAEEKQRAIRESMAHYYETHKDQPVEDQIAEELPADRETGDC